MRVRGLALLVVLIAAPACRRTATVTATDSPAPLHGDQGTVGRDPKEEAEANRLKRLGEEIEGLLRGGKIAEAHRRALQLGEPGDPRRRFFAGHLEQRVAEEMGRHDGPERPSRRAVLFLGGRAAEERDLCGPGARVWLRAAVEHLRRFERYVPGRAHGRGGVVARIGESLVCGGDLPAARRELERWTSPWARWQRAWYALLAGDAPAAAVELSSAELEGRVPRGALSASRLLLALQLQPDPASRELRALACRSAGAELATWCALPAGRRLATGKLRATVRLPSGARARLYLLPLELDNAAVARDDGVVFRNLSFFHYRTDIPSTGSVSVAGIVPTRYALALRVWPSSGAPLRLARPLPRLDIGSDRAATLPEVRVEIRVDGR
jgi:hypothetical protein